MPLWQSILYGIGLAVGTGLIFWAIWKEVHRVKDIIDETKVKLHKIVPTLQEMDSLLHREAEKVAKKPFDKEEYVRLNFRINAEVFGFPQRELNRMQKATTLTELYQTYEEFQRFMIIKYGNRQPDWLDSAEIIAAVLDNKGFGLKEFKGKGKYKKLLAALSKLRTTVSDKQIHNDIESHLSDSETLNTMTIAKLRESKIRVTIKGQTYTATSFMPLQLVGAFEGFENRVRARMEATRQRINQRINMIENKPNPNRDKHKRKRLGYFERYNDRRK